MQPSSTPRDFDVSLSAYAPGLEIGNRVTTWASDEHSEVGNILRVEKKQSETIVIRDIPSHLVLKRSEAISFFSPI